MADRYFSQFRGALEKGVVELFAKVTIGNTGAPTLVSASSKGITGIVRNSAGNYTVTLQDKYRSLLFFDVNFQSATGIGAAPIVSLYGAPAVDTGPTVRFVCTTVGAGSATDPASGETMIIKLELSNSSAI